MPSRRASDKPIAIACFGFVTFLPLRPLFSLPSFIARISRSTSLLAPGEYFRLDEVLLADLLDGFFEDAFVAGLLRADLVADFLAGCLGAFFADLVADLLDFFTELFAADFLVAI